MVNPEAVENLEIGGVRTTTTVFLSNIKSKKTAKPIWSNLNKLTLIAFCNLLKGNTNRRSYKHTHLDMGPEDLVATRNFANKFGADYSKFVEKI